MPRQAVGFRNLLCLILLVSGSPALDEIKLDTLRTIQQAPTRKYMKTRLLALSRILAGLEVIPRSFATIYPKDWEQIILRPHYALQRSEDEIAGGHNDSALSGKISDPGIVNSHRMAPPHWQWPVDISSYDRTPQLSAQEQGELAVMVDRFARGILPWRNSSRIILQRLTHPLYDVFQLIETKTRFYSRIAHIMLEEMHYRQTSFWAWSESEWLETIGQHDGDFHRRHKGKKNDAFRQSLAAVGYLLCRFHAFTLVDRINPYPLACKVFGRQRVNEAVQRIHHPLTSWGYARARYDAIKNALCVVLLSNQSPFLEDIALPLLESLQASQMQRYLKPDLYLISLALVHLDLLQTPLVRRLTPDLTVAAVTHSANASKGQLKCGDTLPVTAHGQIDPTWLEWCQRWRQTSTLYPKTRQSIYYTLLQVGRWLKQTHSQVNTPAGWNRELATEYVATVSRLTVGRWSQSTTIPTIKRGKPVTPRHQAHTLAAMRRFFRDCQEWEWIPVTFDPGRSLATPRATRGKIGANPRVLSDDVWAKLLAAGLSVTEQDFINSQSRRKRPGSTYPMEMLRALVMVWLFGGLRSDEICRLRVGCARFVQPPGNEEPATEAETTPLARVCLLDIPVNKSETAYTKPVDIIVGEAILAWEQVRPIQPSLLDRTTGEIVQYLFAFRLTRLAKGYLNEVVIPALCRKAGIPRSDARGNITSHRARSTIASQLANAKEPMTLFELQQWLGHKRLESTRNYVRSSPTKLARAYADAEYFKRNLRMIDVLIDQDAIKSGAANLDAPWRFYDLGHGYCSYDFFDQCPHRMACAKCAFYRPKGSSEAQMLEAKANLLRMKQEIPLTEEERAAVDDGLNALEHLYEQLLNTPTPAGPTPKELARGKQTLPMLPQPPK